MGIDEVLLEPWANSDTAITSVIGGKKVIDQSTDTPNYRVMLHSNDGSEATVVTLKVTSQDGHSTNEYSVVVHHVPVCVPPSLTPSCLITNT